MSERPPVQLETYTTQTARIPGADWEPSKRTISLHMADDESSPTAEELATWLCARESSVTRCAVTLEVDGNVLTIRKMKL